MSRSKKYIPKKEGEWRPTARQRRFVKDHGWAFDLDSGLPQLTYKCSYFFSEEEGGGGGWFEQLPPSEWSPIFKDWQEVMEWIFLDKVAR